MSQKRSGTNKRVECPYCGCINSNVISENDVPFIRGQGKSFIKNCIHCSKDISYCARYEIVLEASPIYGDESSGNITIN